jgi:hypothetical protein
MSVDAHLKSDDDLHKREVSFYSEFYNLRIENIIKHRLETIVCMRMEN